MGIKELSKDFQQAYHELVDNVEELVVKERKNLQQALDEAEKLLDEKGDLAEDEIKKASSELKHDFKNLNLGLNKAKEAYKEEFSLDAAYLTDSIWEQLHNIMDSNTAHLLAFEKNLEERVQEIKAAQHLRDHSEHTEWNSEHGLWLTEVSLWKRESILAQQKLSEIGTAIKLYSNALDEHAQVIEAHAATEHDHEKAMANAEKDPSSEVFEAADDTSAAVHKQEKKEHLQHAELQNTMKQHHNELMFLVDMLHKKAAK